MKAVPVPFDWRWPAAIVLLFSLLVAFNPVGFRGGGGDDWQYLQAARCWAEHGPCVPRDHWWGRWPLIATMGGLLALLGESRTTLALVPLGATLGCGAIVVHLGNRLFGAPAGWLAALLFLTTPIVLFEALDPTVGTLELLALLCAAALLLRASERQQVRDWLLAGLLLGVAFQVRETSLAAWPAAGLFLLATAKCRLPASLALAAGAMAPLAVEFIVYGLATGEPLFRRQLSLAHTTIASSEIGLESAASSSPLFNLALIAGWEHESGIALHWLINGPIEVLVNEKSGWTMLVAAVALLFAGRAIGRDERRAAYVLLAVGTSHALLLIYLFSIDPKPRMMLVPLAAAALVLGALLARLPRWTGLAMIVLRIAALVPGFLFVPRMGEGEAAARTWLGALSQGSVETAEATRRRLALVPAAAALPLADGSRPLLLLRTRDPCDRADVLELAPPGGLRLVTSQPLGNRHPLTGRHAALCLYAYASPEAARALAARHDARSPFTEEAAEAGAPPPSLRR